MHGREQVSTMAPAVTVCVTCYNQEALIGQCLDGILAQDLEDLEILVGDDFSTDRSIEIIQDYASRDARILLIRRPNNLGFIANEEDLFRRARGNFVAICEGDDIWTDPHKLSRQLAIMSARPDVSLCISAGTKIDDDGNTLPGVLCISNVSRELNLPELIGEIGGRVPTASLLMRRTALEALPDDIYRHVGIDYSLQVLLGMYGKVWYDACPSVAYRVSSRGSWTEELAESSSKYLQHHEALRSYQDFLQRQLGPTLERELRKAFEPLILGFYMSSRISPADKRRNLPDDVPRLKRPAQIVATLLTRAPFLVSAGAFARRRAWQPVRQLLSSRW
jgi:glycosyltransferase involved in cell wall biosynthesis